MKLGKICYCFGHTRESIREEIRRTGGTTVVAEIMAKIRDGCCACATLHPKGVCCLSDVREEVRTALEGVEAAPKP